ncbi:hypothetical protein ACLOJK_038402, partial [Asimina triloba]
GTSNRKRGRRIERKESKIDGITCSKRGRKIGRRLLDSEAPQRLVGEGGENETENNDGGNLALEETVFDLPTSQSQEREDSRMKSLET